MPALTAPAEPGTLVHMMREVGHNQASLARACNVSQATVSRWLNGQQLPTKLGNRRTLARALRVPVPELDEAIGRTATLSDRATALFRGSLVCLHLPRFVRPRHALALQTAA